jgi:hypothetical protein
MINYVIASGYVEAMRQIVRALWGERRNENSNLTPRSKCMAPAKARRDGDGAESERNRKQNGNAWRQPKPGETGTALNRKEIENRMETENRTATESLYRDPAGERPDRQGLTRHRKRVLVGDPKGRLQA